MTNDIHRLLASLDGLRIPGGCDSCDAYQDLATDAAVPGLTRLTVRHDDDCPWLLEQERRTP